MRTILHLNQYGGNEAMNLRTACLLVFSCLATLASANTTINNTNKFAYGANIGWINWQADTNSGASVGHYF